MMGSYFRASSLVFLIFIARRASADIEDELRMVLDDKGWYSSEEGQTPSSTQGRGLLQAGLSSDFQYAANFIKTNGGLSRLGGKKKGAKLRRRCRNVRGRWCGAYDMQAPVPHKPLARSDKKCPGDCNGVGNCHHGLGKCFCAAGWKGDDCKMPEKRPCNSGDRPSDSDEPQSHIDEDGYDLGWTKPGWRASRCAGICDADLAMCWCGDGKYKRINAPKGSPPGTPPIQRGRPLSEWCGKVKEDKNGTKTDWGNVPYSMIYGPEGWCEADRPEAGKGRCDNCMVDDIGGVNCDIVKEAYCPNQCSGHGWCNLGFCKCHEGWYGIECSLKVAGAPMEPSDVEKGIKPWLKGPGLGLLPPSAEEKPSLPARKRPLIYVYDSPPPYTTRMLQYRLVWKACVWRHFDDGNSSELHDWLYGVETYFHEMMLNSPHRTFDPEEADYFYVPIYVTCFFWPTLGWADHPWWHAPAAFTRPMHGLNMILDLKHWIEENYPYWKRRGGRDHIWLMAADEGACWMPTEVYQNSIILSHWGRLDTNHTSDTGFLQDNYNKDYKHEKYQPDGWTHLHQGHVCYNASKDLVIPSLKLPQHYIHSPLLGAEPRHRDILLFFKGDVGARRDPAYSRGIRQKLRKLSQEGKWGEKHRIFILSGEEAFGQYSAMLARAVFCLVAPGDGWSARTEDAVLHGCIPLIIMDNVHVVFESILDWDSFSIRIRQHSLEDIPTILESIPEEQVSRMQRRLTQVWHRFAFTTSPLIEKAVNETIERNFREVPADRTDLPEAYPIQRVREFPFKDDAFGTVMNWLYAKIPETR